MRRQSRAQPQELISRLMMPRPVSMWVVQGTQVEAADGPAYWRRGDTRIHTPFRIPRDERISVGLWEAGRGCLVHHMVMDKRVRTLIACEPERAGGRLQLEPILPATPPG